jgi:hypothetical protein
MDHNASTLRAASIQQLSANPYHQNKITSVLTNETHLVQPQLLRSLTKHKQHGINNITLPTAIWSNYRRESFVEWTDGFGPRVGFEVDQFLAGKAKDKAVSRKKRRKLFS